MSDTAKDWMTRKEASAYLHTLGCPISPGSLAGLAENNNSGKGPPYTRSGWRMVRYNRKDLDAWVKKRVERIA